MSHDNGDEHILHELIKEKHEGHKKDRTKLRVPLPHRIVVKDLNHHLKELDDRVEQIRVLGRVKPKDGVTHDSVAKETNYEHQHEEEHVVL